MSESGDSGWSIADVAAHFEITPRALRFYENKGLLSPDRSHGSRIFSASDRKQIKRILRAKRLGFSLTDIKAVLEVKEGEVKDRAELIRRKKKFENVIRHLKRQQQDIDIVLHEMQTLCTAIDEYVKTAPESEVFQLAEAYEALFRKQMDEEFLTQVSGEGYADL